MRPYTPASRLPVCAGRDPEQPGSGSSSPSLLEVVRRSGQAWMIRKTAEAEIVVLEARRRLAVARRQTESTELEVALQEERLLAIHSVEVARLTVERERLRRELMLTPQPAPIPLPAPGIQVDLTDQQIEALALRAVTRFSGLRGDQETRAWHSWWEELHRRFPQNLADEIGRRANTLRSLNR